MKNLMTTLSTALAAAIVISVATTGCTATGNPSYDHKRVKGSKLIVLHNPETKDTKECKGDPWANWNVYAATEACAQAYEKVGYQRVGSY
jgi:hypothetical protein